MQRTPLAMAARSQPRLRVEAGIALADAGGGALGPVRMARRRKAEQSELIRRGGGGERMPLRCVRAFDPGTTADPLRVGAPEVRVNRVASAARCDQRGPTMKRLDSIRND